MIARLRSPLAPACVVGLSLAAMLVGCADGAPEVVEEPVGEAPVASVPIAAELVAPGVVSTDGFELGTSLDPEGGALYFTQIGDGFETSDIMVSKRVSEAWGTPAPISFSGPYRDLDPFLSADGGKMFFQSDRPVVGAEAKDWDIWVAEREVDGWGAPRNLGPAVNTTSVETYPVVTADGSLYFSSDRGRTDGGDDVYRSRWVDGEYLAPELFGPPIDSPAQVSNVFVARDESYLIVSSAKLPGHLGGGDLYISRRADGAWTPFEPLPFVNTPAREFAPAVSPDGRSLYFTRDQRDPELGEVVLGDLYRIDLAAIGVQ